MKFRVWLLAVICTMHSFGLHMIKSTTLLPSSRHYSYPMYGQFVGKRSQINMFSTQQSPSSWFYPSFSRALSPKSYSNLRNVGFRNQKSSLPLALASSFIRIRQDPWYVWTILSLASTVGILGERTNLGATLSSPLTTTLLTMLLCNIGLLVSYFVCFRLYPDNPHCLQPSTSPVYNIVLKTLVPLAIPLLLLDADMNKCINRTGSLLKAFLIGTMGTVVGTVVAYMLVPMKGLPGASSIAAALCARHVS